MYSMTGYGKAVYSLDGFDITVELKSVNNRYLDINSKYPRLFNAYDDLIRKSVQSRLTRGRVDLFITYSDNRERDVALNVDLSLARSYASAAKTLLSEIDGLENDLTVTSLMKMSDVITSKNTDDTEDFSEILKSVICEACDNLNAMRKREGEKLKDEILSHLAVIESTVNRIGERAPKIQIEYRKKLEERISEYLDGVAVDEARLLNEVAFFADKSNIDEEIARLYSHISQFRKICQSDSPGKKLDFLIQEFNREANTICSKANDVDITALGLELKCEIEKIREQIQNLE